MLQGDRSFNFLKLVFGTNFIFFILQFFFSWEKREQSPDSSKEKKSFLLVTILTTKQVKIRVNGSTRWEEFYGDCYKL